MFKQLFDKVADAVAATDANDTQPADREHALRLATAVLMVEVARADHEFGEDEFHALLRLIEQGNSGDRGSQSRYRSTC